jgi:hypothetical protein
LPTSQSLLHQLLHLRVEWTSKKLNKKRVTELVARFFIAGLGEQA